MRMLIDVLMPLEPFNTLVKNGTAGQIIEKILGDLKPEAAYFAARDGKPIPEGWAIDRDGRPTTDARAALEGSMLPAGGAKGAMLALIVELLACALSGSAYGFAFGFAVHAIVGALWSRGTAGHTDGGGTVGGWLEHWVLLPTNPERIGGWAYFALIVAALALTVVRGWWRTLLLIPTLYLAAFVWENKLVEQVSGATRLILLGALLVVIMNVRPSGIFGTARVEVV